MKIARIPPLAYTPAKLTYRNFIRGGIGADYHQNPFFHQFPNGDLLLYWSAYDYDECSPNSIKLFSISKDRGITWSDPQVYAADFVCGIPDYIAILPLRGSADALMLVCRMHHDIEVDETTRMATKHADYFNNKTRVFLRRSSDHARTFDYGTEIPHTLICGGRELPNVGLYGSNDSFIQLQSGRIIATFTFLDPARCGPTKWHLHFTGVCLISDDLGKTWTRSGEIHADTSRGVMEPQIVETSPNRLYCLFRTAGGFLYETISENGGQTWSPSKPSPLPSPESMPRMIKLQSGNLLALWNNVSSTTQLPRHPMAAALSKDGGRTWGEHRIIAPESGTNQLSNHGVIQLDDGRILAGISHYHDIKPMTSDLDIALFDEAWLLNPEK